MLAPRDSPKGTKANMRPGEPRAADRASGAPSKGNSNAIKDMTDEQIEQSIEMVKAMIAEREAGANAKVIDGVPEPANPRPALPPPSRRASRKVRRSDRAESGLSASVVGTDSAGGNS